MSTGVSLKDFQSRWNLNGEPQGTIPDAIGVRIKARKDYTEYDKKFPQADGRVDTTGQSNNNGIQNKKTAAYPTTGDNVTQVKQQKCAAQTGLHPITKTCVDYVYELHRNDRRGGNALRGRFH
jgi:hypothetical protein